MIDLRLVQLMGCYDNDLATGNCLYIAKDPDSAPWDFIATSDMRMYSDMMAPAGMADIKKYSDGIGP